MNLYLYCIITGIIMLGGFSAQNLHANAFGDHELELSEGEIKTIPANGVIRIAVGDGSLVKVQLIDNTSILLIGELKGTTSLRTWTSKGEGKSFRITVKDKTDSQDINLRQIVSMKVRIVEFREASLKQIGIDWGKTASGPTFFVAKDFISNTSTDLIQSVSQSSLGMVGQMSQTPLFLGSNIALRSTISFMQSAGHASTLAEPTLSCLSGESASFLAGGEVPITVVGQDGIANVSFKNYGIGLHVSPVADRHGRISTSIETEVSSIDGSVSVNGIPGFVSRKTSTHMNVLSGQTIVIAGLLSKNAREDIQYIPGLGNLPVIGSFFQSRNMSQEETQLVVFVTPTIINPEALSSMNSHSFNPEQNQIQQQQWHSILDQGMAEISIDIEG